MVFVSNKIIICKFNSKINLIYKKMHFNLVMKIYRDNVWIPVFFTCCVIFYYYTGVFLCSNIWLDYVSVIQFCVDYRIGKPTSLVKWYRLVEYEKLLLWNNQKQSTATNLYTQLQSTGMTHWKEKHCVFISSQTNWLILFLPLPLFLSLSPSLPCSFYFCFMFWGTSMDD